MKDDSKSSARRPRNDLISGRKFSADELELMVLWFLGDAPTHGYELIKRFDTLSEGYYSPSPGVLYPALGRLQARGYLHAEHAGRRKSYRLTDTGKTYLNSNSVRSRQLLDLLKHAAKKMVWMNHASENVLAAADATGWLPEFVQTRRALQFALLKHSDSDHDEQRRVIAILQQTIADILETSPHVPATTTHQDPNRD